MLNTTQQKEKKKVRFEVERKAPRRMTNTNSRDTRAGRAGHVCACPSLVTQRVASVKERVSCWCWSPGASRGFSQNFTNHPTPRSKCHTPSIHQHIDHSLLLLTRPTHRYGECWFQTIFTRPYFGSASGSNNALSKGQAWTSTR